MWNSDILIQGVSKIHPKSSGIHSLHRNKENSPNKKNCTF